MEINPLPKQALAWQKLLDKETKYVLFGGAAGGGKFVGENDFVLGPNGWRKSIDLEVGQNILNPDGSVQKIIQVKPWVELEKWTVHFSDGTHLDVAGDHLWQAWKARKSRKINGDRTFGEDSSEVIETRELKEWLDRGYTPQIPVTKPLNFTRGCNDKNQLDPYLLGILLGDGCFTEKNLTITAHRDDIPHLESYFGDYEHSIGRNENADTFRFKGESKKYIKERLVAYKLDGLKSFEKFIPSGFLWSSSEKRLAVLQGLMDSDGFSHRDKNAAEFVSTSKQLADDVAFCVRSLGGTVTMSEKEPYYRDENWEKVSCKKAWRLYIRLPNPDDLFRMERKKHGIFGKNLVSKKVVDVTIGGVIRGHCITVSNPNGLYITNDFTVTHNSWLGAEWLLSMCLSYPGSKWFIGRDELKKIMSSVVVTFQKVCRHHKIPERTWRLNGQYNYIDFANGSRIDLLDLKKTPIDPMFERFGSMEFTGGWIEEGGEVDGGAFEILKSRIARHMANEVPPKILITANPKKNWLYYMFYLPNKEGTLPKDHAFIEAKFADNEYTKDVYGEQLKSLRDKVMRQRLEYGEWEYDDDETALLDYDDILGIFTPKKDDENDGKNYMTIDPAFKGKDMAVIMIWKGFEVRKIIQIPKADHSTLMQLIDLYARQENVPRRNIVADVAGEGGYLASMLPGIRGFIGGSSPLADKDAQYDEMKKAFYANLRTQCVYEMSHMVKIGKVKVVEPSPDIKKKLIEELQLWRVEEVTDEKRLKIIGKDEMKSSMGGRSPDFADALYMRAFFELNGDKSGATTEVQRKQLKMNETRPFDRWGV